MFFLDYIILGLYFIFNKVSSIFSSSKKVWGPKEYAFYISIAVHTINIQTVWSFVSARYFQKPINFILFLIVALTFIIINYLIYYRNKRFDFIIEKGYSSFGITLCALLSSLYVSLSVYSMFMVGNINREMLTGESISSNKLHIEGVYFAIPSIQTLDTLAIYSNGEYKHSIYRRSNNSLVNVNNGQWEINIDRLVLKNFFLNKDELLDEKEIDFTKRLATFSFPYKNISGETLILFGEETNDHYYQRVMY